MTMGDTGIERKTPERSIEAHKEGRRGSHLLSAAGIGYGNRRKHSAQGSCDASVIREGKVFVEEKDGTVSKLEILEVQERMGMMRKAVPTLPLGLAILLCLINTILPGIGTLIGASTLLCCWKSHYEKNSDGFKFGLMAGILQLLTAIVIVGWIYSIMYGVYMIQDSVTRAAYKKNSNGEEQGVGNPYILSTSVSGPQSV